MTGTVIGLAFGVAFFFVAVEVVHWIILLLTMGALATTYLLVAYADGIRCSSVILGFGGMFRWGCKEGLHPEHFSNPLGEGRE